MNCPRCGYVCPPLETYCLRCRVIAAQGDRPRIVPTAERTMILSDMSDLDRTMILSDVSQYGIRSSRPWSAWRAALCVTLALLVGLAVAHLALAHQPADAHAAANRAAPSR